MSRVRIPGSSTHHKTRAYGFALCLSLVLAAPLVNADDQATERANTLIAFELDSGPLATVLSRFAQQVGITLAFDPARVDGLTSAGLNGSYRIEDGLERLLAGSGLAVQRTSTGYAVVPLAGPADRYQLNAIHVEADAVAATGVSPVSGYTALVSRSASKTDTPLLETPQSVSVVTARQIADRKALSVQEAVSYTAGVRIGESGMDPRFDQIQIRGFAATTTADFLDGLRQPNTGWLSYFGTEPYNLERIDIVKGPASVLYGQINPGGMVNRISKRPTDTEQHEVELQYGSYEHLQGQFDSSGRLDHDGDVRYRLVGVVRDAETDIEQVDNDTLLLAPSLTWRIGDHTNLTLLSQYQDRLTSGSPRPYQEGSELTDFWAGDEDFDKLDQRQVTLGYEFDHAFSNAFSLQQSVRFGDVDTTNQYLSVSGSNGSVLDRVSYGIYEDMQTVATDTRLVGQLATGAVDHTVMIGLDYRYTDYDVVYATGAAPSIDRQAPDFKQPVSHPDSVISDLSGHNHNSGLYLQDQLAAGNWRLSAGLRQDWVNSRNADHLTDSVTKSHDDKTSGQLGALYLFDGGLAPYASYAQSFLPQSGSDVSGNAYHPTEGEQYELGLKYQPPGSLTLLTASLYHLTQSNVLTSDPDNPVNRIQTGEQVSRGLELEAVSELSNNLQLTASYSLNDAEVTSSNDGNEGKAPTNIPRHLAALWLDYSLPGGPLSGLNIAGGARWTGSAYANAANTQKNDAYTLVDIGVQYDLPGSLQGFRVGVNAKNLFDKRYLTCSDGYCYRGDARSVIGSISYRW